MKIQRIRVQWSGLEGNMFSGEVVGYPDVDHVVVLCDRVWSGGDARDAPGWRPCTEDLVVVPHLGLTGTLVERG